MSIFDKKTEQTNTAFDDKNEEVKVQGSLPLPTSFVEFNDGSNWYKLATEQFCIDNITTEFPCLYATTANLTSTYTSGSAGVGATLTSTTAQFFTIDGGTPGIGDRVLVKDQAAPAQNGIYQVTNGGSVTTNWVLTRTDDYDFSLRIKQGSIVPIALGAANGVTSWMQTAVVVSVGTSPITFAKMSGGASIQAVVGTPDQINVVVANGIATVSIANNPIIPGTASITLPKGTTLERPAVAVAGMLRFNTGL